MNRKMYSEFVKTVILKPFLQYLFDENIKSRFLNIFLDRVEHAGLSPFASSSYYHLHLRKDDLAHVIHEIKWQTCYYLPPERL